MIIILQRDDVGVFISLNIFYGIVYFINNHYYIILYYIVHVVIIHNRNGALYLSRYTVTSCT